MAMKKDLRRDVGVYTASFLLVAGIVGLSCSILNTTPDEPAVTSEATTESVRIEAPWITFDTTHAAETTEAVTEAYTSLGEYKLTAYCACEACCGAWAADRPLDKDGKPIVYTASMAEAKQGVTVSADTSILPFGTVVEIDGNEYIVQDRGGSVKGKHIDIYFDSHEEAKEFGVQYAEVFLKEAENVLE